MLQKKLRPYIIILWILTCAFPVFGKNDFDVNALFSITAHPELEAIDFYSVRADVEFSFSVATFFFCTLEIEADRFEISPGEISVKWFPNDYIQVKIGKFSPDITMEHYLSKDKRLFTTTHLITDYIDILGYRISTIGGKIYKKYDKKTLPISYVLHVFFNTAQFEPQVMAGFFYHFNKKDSYLGILGCYIPYITHSLQLPEDIEWHDNNFTTSFIVNDYEKSLLYGCELILGSNLLDPVGIIHYPGNGNFTLFCGIDAYVGYPFEFTNFTWIPALRYTILFPNIDVMEYSNMEILLGNTFRFKKDVYCIVDSGLGINNINHNNELYTQLEFLWGIKLLVTY